MASLPQHGLSAPATAKDPSLGFSPGNRSWVSTGQPSQAEIDNCWDEVRRNRILHAERERRALMQIPQHQGGDSEWMVCLEIDLQVSRYLVGESETAARTL